MTKKTLYKLKDLIMYYEPKNLALEGGTIEYAVFQKPTLLEYRFTFPKGFKFPPEFYKLRGFNKDKEISFNLSMKHSNKNDIILCSLSSNLYTRIIHEIKKGNEYKNGMDYRFILCMEHQSLVSLVSVFENFLKNVQKDNKKNARIFNNFLSVNGALYNCNIECKNLEGLRNEKVFERAINIIDYLFNLRNLIVHNGGVVNNWFYKKYRSKINKKEIGKVIRINYEDYEIIRQWLSFFIQEVCRVNKGYDKVWTDYLISTGIILPDIFLKLKTKDGEETKIPLKDGVEIIGKYDSKSKSDKKVIRNTDKYRTFGFELDFGKLIKSKKSKGKKKKN